MENQKLKKKDWEKEKKWSAYDNKQIWGDNFFTGYMFCPICGVKGELLEGILVMSVAEDWIEETPFICPKCRDEDDMFLTIGFAGIKKGKRKEFFDDLIRDLEEK